MNWKWEYIGDVNLEYGGVFFDISNWQHGYVSAVRVTDLDSACGQRNCYLIEHIVVLVDKKRIAQALPCVGLTPADLIKLKGHVAKKLTIADACLSYGYHDPDDSWDNYRHHHTECVAIGEEGGNVGELGSSGFRINKRLRSNVNLKKYIEKEHLK